MMENAITAELRAELLTNHNNLVEKSDPKLIYENYVNDVIHGLVKISLLLKLTDSKDRKRKLTHYIYSANHKMNSMRQKYQNTYIEFNEKPIHIFRGVTFPFSP
jgi:hypothetical protein